MVAYCEVDDVRQALLERDLTGAVGNGNVEPAVTSLSDWFQRRARYHVYDSTGSGTLVGSSAATAADVRLDVPSSPHAQDRQLLHDEHGVRYPVTHSGPYARIRLPHGHVQSLTTLNVRERGGSVTDWTSDPQFVEGRGEDYYVQVDGTHGYGTTYLYVRASSIGARVDFGDLLTVDYEFGLGDTDEWEDVRRGIAALAAAQVVSDDDVLAQIPDNGQLIGVDTQHQQLIDEADRLLGPYITRPVA